MRLNWALGAPVLSILLVIVLLAPSASVQAAGGTMAVEGKLRLSGLVSLQGSGTAKITYSGAAAGELRLGIFAVYGTGGNEYLDVNNTRAFLDSVSEALVGKIYWGITIKSATKWANESDDYVSGHTDGIMRAKWDSTDPISFEVDYSGSGEAQTKVLQIGQGVYDCFAASVYEAVGYLFNGTLQVSQRVTSFTFGSFTSPNFTDGKASAIREPLGEVLWFSYTGQAGPGIVATDQMAFESFSFMENQQLSFIVLLIGALVILRMPGKNFDKFAKLHPKKFRKYAKPLLIVRISAWVLVAVLSLLYLLPYAFGFLSPNALLYAAYLYLLVPLAAIGEYFFARGMYKNASLSIPDESVIEVKQAQIAPAEGAGELLCKACYRQIEGGLEMFLCPKCGANLHADCAEKAQNCPVCGEMLFPERTRSIQCKSCGDTFIYSGIEDPYSIQCPSCGAFQEEIAPGKNYLVVDEDPRNAYMMIRAMALSGRPTMCMTTQFPGKIRSDYELIDDVTIKWFSDSTTDIDNLNPKDLEGDSMEIVSTFLMTTKQAGVLIEGIDALTEMNGFDKVLAFVKRINDLASIHGSTVILAVNKKKLSEEQFKAVSDEFDEIHDYQ